MIDVEAVRTILSDLTAYPRDDIKAEVQDGGLFLLVMILNGTPIDLDEQTKGQVAQAMNAAVSAREGEHSWYLRYFSRERGEHWIVGGWLGRDDEEW